MCSLRHRLFSHLMSQEIGFFDRIRTGELMNRLSEVFAHLQPALLRHMLHPPQSFPPLKRGVYSNKHQVHAWCFTIMTCLSARFVGKLPLCCMVVSAYLCVPAALALIPMLAGPFDCSIFHSLLYLAQFLLPVSQMSHSLFSFLMSTKL